MENIISILLRQRVKSPDEIPSTRGLLLILRTRQAQETLIESIEYVCSAKWTGYFLGELVTDTPVSTRRDLYRVPKCKFHPPFSPVAHNYRGLNYAIKIVSLNSRIINTAVPEILIMTGVRKGRFINIDENVGRNEAILLR